MPRIHWITPTLMLASLVVGIFFALGHHLFYASLEHKPAPTSIEGYYVLGTHVSFQQFDTAIGTAFAFLVRACLILSISIAYFQIFIWSIGKRGAKGTGLAHLDVMTSAMQDLVSLANFNTWWRHPWLWVLAVVAWLLPIASIITPATLSIGIDIPRPIFVNVPNVDFFSLNLAAPMPIDNINGSKWSYIYAGPSLPLQIITGAVAAQGSLLPVAAPSVNSTWDLNFSGPTLHCSPASSDFRHAVLDNILDYTFLGQAGFLNNCTFGPGYVAWHPPTMRPGSSMTDFLPFNKHEWNSSKGPLNNYQYILPDMASMFLVIAPTLFNTTFDEAENYLAPTLCQGQPWYQTGLAEYHNTSTVLRCDVHNSTYHTTFSFVNGEQDVSINNVTDGTDTPMLTTMRLMANYNTSNTTDMSLQPGPCPPPMTTFSCLYHSLVLSTLSYQAVMNSFKDLLVETIFRGADSKNFILTSTTQLGSTILAEAPELAFLEPTVERFQNSKAITSVQQSATMWKQQPFIGLVNTAVAPKVTLPIQQALEQLFQNITISLMSAPEFQYVQRFFLSRIDSGQSPYAQV